jgi:succinate-acetate transporter protein
MKWTVSKRVCLSTTVGSASECSQIPLCPSNLCSYHLSSPYPLFAIGVGASLLTLGLVFVNARGLANPQIFLNVGLPLGGVGVLTASMFSFAEGNTFLATAAGTLGGLIAGLSLVFLPWTGIEAAYAESPADLAMLNKALGILFFAAMIPVFVLFLASFKTAVPISVSALLIVIALILQGSAYLSYPMFNLTKACGALFIVVGVLLVSRLSQ